MRVLKRFFVSANRPFTRTFTIEHHGKRLVDDKVREMAQLAPTPVELKDLLTKKLIKSFQICKRTRFRTKFCKHFPFKSGKIRFRMSNLICYFLRIRYAIGMCKDLRLEHAKFLHREVPLRIAQRIVDLDAAPFQLGQRQGMRDIIQWYLGYWQALVETDVPICEKTEARFTHLLRTVFTDHTEVNQAVAMGVFDLKKEVGEDRYLHDCSDIVNDFLNRFFMARIGMRFLLQHHIDSKSNRRGFSG